MVISHSSSAARYRTGVIGQSIKGRQVTNNSSAGAQSLVGGWDNLVRKCSILCHGTQNFQCRKRWGDGEGCRGQLFALRQPLARAWGLAQNQHSSSESHSPVCLHQHAGRGAFALQAPLGHAPPPVFGQTRHAVARDAPAQGIAQSRSRQIERPGLQAHTRRRAPHRHCNGRLARPVADPEGEKSAPHRRGRDSRPVPDAVRVPDQVIPCGHRTSRVGKCSPLW